jgi:septum formation inhibitor-activating ATPase MinD
MNEEIDECILVCTPDDICIRNAERAASVIEKKELPRPQLIVNRLDEALVCGGEMYSATTVAATLDLPLLGEILDDSYVYRAMLTHQSVMDIDCEARNALTRITYRMLGVTNAAALPGYGTAKLPWYKRIFQPTLKEVKRIDR